MASFLRRFLEFFTRIFRRNRRNGTLIRENPEYIELRERTNSLSSIASAGSSSGPVAPGRQTEPVASATPPSLRISAAAPKPAIKSSKPRTPRLLSMSNRSKWCKRPPARRHQFGAQSVEEIEYAIKKAVVYRHSSHQRYSWLGQLGGIPKTCLRSQILLHRASTNLITIHENSRGEILAEREYEAERRGELVEDYENDISEDSGETMLTDIDMGLVSDLELDDRYLFD